MQRLLFILILLTKFLLIKSQFYLTSTRKVSLSCNYPEKSSGIIQLSNTAYIIPKYQADHVYVLTGSLLNKNTLRILSIQCISIKYNTNNCSINFQSSHISLKHINDDDCVIKIEEKNSEILTILLYLSLNKNYDQINLTCAITAIYNGSKDPHNYPLSEANLFSVIFVSICVAMTCSLCIGWMCIVYYRRFKQHRMKKREQKKLERSVQQILDKSPIIIFNSNNNDDSMCAVCLETFINNEKLRKLVCSHCFHMACVDPWLLAHQNCPLCNQNILNDSVPSISARITSANDELSNRESAPRETPVVN